MADNNDESEVIDVREPLVAQGADIAPRSEDTNVFSAKKRLGMVGVLFVIAGTAMFFNAEEGLAESKIWESEMSEIKNATALPELRNRKFSLKPAITWTQANHTCATQGMFLCSPHPRLCQKPRSVQNQTRIGGRKNKRQQQEGLSHFPGLCENGKRCNDPVRNSIRKANLPVLSGGKPAWVKMSTCVVTPSNQAESFVGIKNGVVACCSDKPGGKKVVAAFAPSIIAKAIKGKEMFMGKFQKKNKPWGKKAKDSWDKMADKYRQSDPFLASKQKGTKMKSFHQHASEQLGNKTIGEHFSNIHGKVQEHIGGLVSSAAALINSDAGSAGPKGPVSGTARTKVPGNAMNSLVASKNVSSISGTVGGMMNGVTQYLGGKVANGLGLKPGPKGPGARGQGAGSRGAAGRGAGIHRGRRPGAHPGSAAATVTPAGGRRNP